MTGPQHPYQSSNTGGMTGLISLIDEHLQYQHSRRDRRDSLGTIFLDYDHITGTHVVRYRNEVKPRPDPAATPERRPVCGAMPKRRPVPTQAGPRQQNARTGPDVHAESSSSSSSCASNTLRQRHAYTPPVSQAAPSVYKVYHAPNGAVFVEGNDQRTHFEWDYDGRTFHVHRDAVQPSSADSPAASAYSEYYAIDARRYASGSQVLVVDKELPHLPQRQRRKRDQVSKFIKEKMNQLHCCNALKLFTDDYRARKEKRRFVRGHSWVHSGYIA